MIPLSKKVFPGSPEEIAKRQIRMEENERRHKEYAEKQEYERIHAVEIEIKCLRKTAAENLSKADKLEKLLEQFPDLLKHTNRWNTVRYYSKSVNHQVTNYDLIHNCGCCSDSPLELWPYVETENGRIYSDPPYFIIGERNYDTDLGDTLNADWCDQLRKASISETLIDKLSKNFSENNAESTEETS